MEVENPKVPEVEGVYEFYNAELIEKDDKTILKGEFGEITIIKELGKCSTPGAKIFEITLEFTYTEDGLIKNEKYPYAMKSCDRLLFKKRIVSTLERTETSLDRLYREIDILKRLNHPNILKTFCIIDDFSLDHIYIITRIGDLGGIMKWDPTKSCYERMPIIYQILQDKGHLGDLNKNSDNEYLEGKGGDLIEKVSKIIFKHISNGLSYLHEKNIVHRDLKWENIVCYLDDDKNLQSMIIDFSIAEDISNDPNYIFLDTAGTPEYNPPEFENYEGFLIKPVDIWCFGICLYTFIFKTFPNEYTDLSDETLELSHNLRDLLKKLLNKDPEKRITIQEVLIHPWFSDQLYIYFFCGSFSSSTNKPVLTQSFHNIDKVVEITQL